jgi:hypothetical protein
MKNFLRILPFVVCGLAGTTFAEDFKSVVVPSTGLTIRVHGDQFMVIRNFTQDAVGPRGSVTVGTPPTFAQAATVLTAAILDPTNNTQGTLEVINSVVIAGPANVIVTPGTGNCFISYKKDSN